MSFPSSRISLLLQLLIFFPSNTLVSTAILRLLTMSLASTRWSLEVVRLPIAIGTEDADEPRADAEAAESDVVDGSQRGAEAMAWPLDFFAWQCWPCMASKGGTKDDRIGGALFTSRNEKFRDTVALSFVCGNYCPTID